METVEFTTDDGTQTFYVIDSTTVGGVSYLLVTEEETGDAEAFLLRDDSAEGDADALYRMVEDDAELQAVGAVFQKLLEDDDVGLTL